MNPKTLMLLIALFCSNAIYAQSESYAPFTITVTGKARNVLSTTSKKDKARLSNGDEVSIIPSQSSWNINIKHEKTGKTISYIEVENIDHEPYIEVFEYDFDDNGTKEICVAYENGPMTFKMEVYRYSGGLSELVGSFDGQMQCEIKNNRIQFEYGQQGIVETYLYEDGIFFELVIHDPNQKIKQ